MTNTLLSFATARNKLIGASFDLFPRGLQLVQETPKGLRPIINDVVRASGLEAVALSDNCEQNNFGEEANTRVLQVEDNAENRFIVHRYLKDEYNFDSVEQGEHALYRLKENTVDVIIMDINLGAGIDGIETAHRIRENNKYKNIAIIAVTANVSLSVKKKCFEAGMDYFLPKPFRKDDLTTAINKVLQDKSGHKN